MKNSSDYYVIDKKVIPDVFLKVIKAKELLANGNVSSVQEACEITDVSRSAFYKYRNYIEPLGDNNRGRTAIIAFNLKNKAGLLSNVLNVIADKDANVLTINQTIPINNVANVTISVETGEMSKDINKLVDEIKKIEGVISLKIIARE